MNKQNEHCALTFFTSGTHRAVYNSTHTKILEFHFKFSSYQTARSPKANTPVHLNIQRLNSCFYEALKNEQNEHYALIF